MRKDIHKVVRVHNKHGRWHPESGATRAKISPKALMTLEYDPKVYEMETRASISNYNGGDFNYRPLEGWLKKQLNRPWDKVYSELCERFDKRTVAGRAIDKWVKQKVELNTFFSEDGKTIMYISEYQRKCEKERPVGGFYLHPKTKCLQYVDEEDYRKAYRKRMAAAEVTEWPSTKKSTKYEKRDGFWYEELFGAYAWTYDAEGNYGPVEFNFGNGKKAFATGLKEGQIKRQLSKKESERLERWIEEWKDREYGK